ncbi:MAG: AraC family transcriptional regulator [Actinomycetota bacterium]
MRRLAALDVSRTADEPRRRNRPRGLPPALADHEVFRHSDIALSARAGRELLGAHRIEVESDRVSDFDAVMHAARFRDVTVAFVDHAVPSTVEIIEPCGDHLVVVPASGVCSVTIDDHEDVLTPITAAVLPTDRGVRLDATTSTTYVVVRIEAQALERHLARLLGRTTERPIIFDPIFELGDSVATRWNTGLQLLLAELLDPESLLRTQRDVGQLEEFLMTALLLGHRSNQSEFFAASKRPSRVVRLARQYVDAHLASPLTVGAIADAAGVGVRTLQNHFADDVGQTPMSYVRDARLDRVRAELADLPADEGATVTEIAFRWGFTHLGRFSIAYRERFGEAPSQTLRS